MNWQGIVGSEIMIQFAGLHVTYEGFFFLAKYSPKRTSKLLESTKFNKKKIGIGCIPNNINNEI